MVTLGLSIRLLRHRRRWTQEELANRAGSSRSAISRLERGEVASLTVGLFDRVLACLEARATIRVPWRGEDLDRLRDEAHAGIVDRVLALLGGRGWLATPEVTFSIYGERGSVDVLGFHPPTGSVLVIEVKSVVPDVQAMLAGLDRKERLAPAIARERGWPGTSVSILLVLPGTRTSYARVERHRATFDRVLPARTAHVRRWLDRPAGSVAGILFLPDSQLPGVRRTRIRGGVSRTRGTKTPVRNVPER